jgi:mono/diheme cytochrome c family protein
VSFLVHEDRARPVSFLVILLVAVFAAAVGARQTVPAAVKKGGDPDAARIKNPVAASPESIAAGKKTYAEYCAGCHNTEAQGGLNPSITEDKGLPGPPALNDAEWDYGSTDGEIFTVLKRGVPPDYIMGPWDGRLPDTDLWNVINFLRSVAEKK